MQDERIEELLARFQGIRSYMWQLVAVVVLLALAINLVSSVIYSRLGIYPSLALGLLLGAACLAYLVYSRLRRNSVSTPIRGFFVFKRDSAKLLYVPAYHLASEFESIASAAFKENPALERQWQGEIQQLFHSGKAVPPGGLMRPGYMRVATEIAEYILLEQLSVHLTDYFNTPSLEESQLETLKRNDIPDVLLSNRILELISRDLEDRPWYEEKSEPTSPDTVVTAVFGPGERYSRFDLTLPKGSTVQRKGPGSLIINSKMISLELSVKIGPDYNPVDPSFANYYLGKRNDASVTEMLVRYEINAHIRRGLGFRIDSWRYYSWLESFIESVRRDFDREEFLRRISWESSEVLLRVIFSRYPPDDSQDSSNDKAPEPPAPPETTDEKSEPDA